MLTAITNKWYWTESMAEREIGWPWQCACSSYNKHISSVRMWCGSWAVMTERENWFSVWQWFRHWSEVYGCHDRDEEVGCLWKISNWKDMVVSDIGFHVEGLWLSWQGRCAAGSACLATSTAPLINVADERTRVVRPYNEGDGEPDLARIFSASAAEQSQSIRLHSCAYIPHRLFPSNF